MNEMVSIPVSEYQRLLAAAEALSDLAAYDAAKARLAAGRDELLPAAFADRLLDGESPLRVWRELRGLTQAALAGLLRPVLSDVNMVNAPIVAKERGISVSEVRRGQQGIYDSYMLLRVETERQKRDVAGTVFGNGAPRIIQVKGIAMEAAFTPHMLYITNEDKPGFIGKLGTLLGNAKVNIASFNLGRTGPGGDAIALVEVDGEVPEGVIESIRAIDVVRQAKALKF